MDVLLLGEHAGIHPHPDIEINRLNMILAVSDKDGMEEAYRLTSPFRVYFNEAKAYQSGERRGVGRWGIVFFAKEPMDMRIRLMNDLPVVYFYHTNVRAMLREGTFIRSEGLREHMSTARRKREVAKAFKKRYRHSPGKKQDRHPTPHPRKRSKSRTPPRRKRSKSRTPPSA